MSDVEDRREEFFKGVAKKKIPHDKIKMPFGKYKGKIVLDVIKFDDKYAKWLFKQEYIKNFEHVYDVLFENLE